MIRAYASEPFPITVALEDVSSGQVVFYDIRYQIGDLPLSPTLSGILPESIDVPGIYTTMVSIDEIGSYFVYINCLGYLSDVEEIIVEQNTVSFSGCQSPEITSESFGSINIMINKDVIRLSTKEFIPIVKVSIEE